MRLLPVYWRNKDGFDMQKTELTFRMQKRWEENNDFPIFFIFEILL